MFDFLDDEGDEALLLDDDFLMDVSLAGEFSPGVGRVVGRSV